MRPRDYVVTHDLSKVAPWAHKAGVRAGDIVQRFTGVTYGCCADWEIPVIGPDGGFLGVHEAYLVPLGVDHRPDHEGSNT